jgi:hypothetical protein
MEYKCNTAKKDCPIKNTCKRFTEASHKWQKYIEPDIYSGQCNNHIPQFVSFEQIREEQLTAETERLEAMK